MRPNTVQGQEPYLSPGPPCALVGGSGLFTLLRTSLIYTLATKAILIWSPACLVSVRPIDAAAYLRFPLVLGSIKRVVRASMNTDVRSAIDFEAHGFAGLGSSKDFKEGMSAFLQKRSANFKGK